MQGYGRDAEMEADELGLEYATKTGYRPEAMADMFKVLKSQESFELQRAKDEGREPNLYHGVFDSHPAPGARAIAAAKGAAKITTRAAGRLGRQPAMPTCAPSTACRTARAARRASCATTASITPTWASRWRSRAAGSCENQHDRILAYTKSNKSAKIADAIMQITSPPRPEKRGPRELLLEYLKGESISKGEALNVNGMDGYTRRHAPRLAARWRRRPGAVGRALPWQGDVPHRGREPFGRTASCRRTTACSMSSHADHARSEAVRISAGAALSHQGHQGDGADEARRLRQERPGRDGYQKEQLLMLNGLYPNGKVKPGQYLKVVE